MLKQLETASPYWQALTSPSTLVLLGILVVGLGSTHWLTLNLWRSVPLGVYRKQALPAHLEYGMLVMFPPPAVIHPWWPWYRSLTKPIAGLPGDQVCVLDETWGDFAGLWVNGEPYGAVLREAYGKVLPRIQGCLIVQPGEVFVATKTVRTIDSRYFSSVPVAALTAQAVPLWIWQ